MQYVGSKKRLSKYILPILLKHRQQRPWVEPFVGGANLIENVDGIRYGNDLNHYLIDLLKQLQQGWIPPDLITKDEYYDIKKNPQNYPTHLYAYASILCSFGAKWWGGYAYSNAERGKRVCLKQATKLDGIIFSSSDYKEMYIPPNSLIYCDPPYQNTTGYNFDIESNNEFWDWCRKMSLDGHLVYVSEYNAPSDFIEIFSKEINSFLNRNKLISKIEKIFTINNPHY